MCFWNKFFLFFVFVGICACFYFSAITLKTHSVWRSNVNRDKAALAEVDAKIHGFKFGAGVPPTDTEIDYWTIEDPEAKFQPSIGYLKKALARVQSFRGNHSWFARPVETSNDGSATVKIEGILPDALPVGTRVYAFEESEDGFATKYMGLFFVKSIDKDSVSLSPDPVAIKYPRMLDKIKSSIDRNWTIYEIMPADSHEAFMGAKVTEEILRNTLPKSTVDEFVKDGQKDASGTTFVRKLRAYQIWFELFFTP